jgi:tetratricopeptide (TPR) repeat protein
MSLREWMLSLGNPYYKLYVSAKKWHQKSPYGFYAGREFLELTEEERAAGRSCPCLNEAEALYRQSIEGETRGQRAFNAATARYQLGLLMHWQGRSDEARAEYERAAAMFNNLPNAEAPGALSDCHFRLGDLWEDRGEIERAIAEFEKSRALDQMRGDANAAFLSEERLRRLRRR